jgi:hypothetical protein
MKKLLSFFGAGLLCSSALFSQGVLTPFEDWSTISGTQNFFHKNFTKTSGSYVYVVGATVNGAGNYDMLLTKTSNSGVLQWTKQYNGLANYHDMATDVYIDASSNVYITGAVVNDTVTFTSDIITIKYNSSGVQQWVATYNGTGGTFDAGAKVIEDGSGNVYVCGGSYNASLNKDYTIIKYNSSGTQQWAVQYNGTANMDDAAVKVGVSGGQLVVLGVSQATSTTYKPLTLNLNLSTGAVISATYSSSSTTSMDVCNDVYKDASGNVYLVGGTPTVSHGYDFTTIKLTAATLALAWEVDYNGASNLDDIASGIQVDGSGNVYVTGYTTSSTQQKNMMTVKYNSSGTQQWLATYNDSLNGNDEATAIVLDASNNVYVTGYDSTIMNGTDYFTIKYNSSGTQIWSIRTDGDAHRIDKAADIALDTTGNVIVTGESMKLNGSFEYKTMRYVQKTITTPADSNSEVPSANFAYYKNNGQLVNTSNSAISSVKYYTNFTNPKYYINNNSFSFVYTKSHSNAAINDTTHRVDVTFNQCSASAKAYAMEEQASYLNYFLAHCPNGVTEIHANNRVVVPNLYPNIDLMYSSNQNGFKYYFIINPGATPSNIEMIYTGASSTAVNGTTHHLSVNTSLGNLDFDRPSVYQLNSSNAIIAITTWHADFTSSGTNAYKFNIGTYDNTKILIIEVDQGNAANVMHLSGPEWSMYFGGTGYDEGTGVTNDTDGNTYFAGFTSSNNFPTSTGLQTGSNGVFEAFAARFGTANGASSSVVVTADQRKWCTYYGGTSDDRAYSISTSGNGTTGSVFITGYTSNGGLITYPQTGAYNQNTNAGGKDAFVLRLDNIFGGANPSIVWSTNFGGYRDEVAKTVKTDGSGNIYVAGSTASNIFTSSTACTVPTDTYFPKCNTFSSFNNGGNFGGGNSDGFITKFSGSGQILWSSFYGGNGVDTINSIGVDGSDNVYFTGTTGSTSGFPLTTLSGGYNQTTFGGDTLDAFIGSFTSSGTHQWCTYFGGSGKDKGIAIAVQSSTNIYVAGETSSSTPACSTCVCIVPTVGQFPLCPLSGAHFQGTGSTGSYGGGSSDGFVAKFDNTGIFKWGTYYGGSGKDVINSLALDYLNQLYFAGKTSSTGAGSGNVYYISGSLPAWYYQQTGLYGPYDGFLGRFDASNARYWASYYGGTATDFYNGISVWGNASNNLFWYTTGATNSIDMYCQAYSSVSAPTECCPNAYTQWTNVGFATSAIVQRFSNWGMYMMSVEDLSNTSTLEALVYPNPASYNVTLSVTLPEKETLTVNVYSISGQLLYTENMGKQQGAIVKQIDFSNFTNGMYLLQVNTDTKTVSKKIIKHD